jgi:PAS domain S-box-containing protein
MAHLLGYSSREAIVGRDVTTFYVDPRDSEPVIARVETEGNVNGVELKWLRADGEPVTVLASISAVREQAGTVLEGFVVDITDRKRVEAAERETEALRSVTRLAITAAHEINNPMAVILGRLELLARRLPDDAAALAAIDKASAAGQRINEIITNMSRISRLTVTTLAPGLPEIIDLWRSSEPDGPPETPSPQ